MPGNFFDTNVLIYLASADIAKAERAKSMVALGGTISVQVLNEIVNVVRRKMRFDWNETTVFLSTIRGLLSVRPVTVDIHEAGLVLCQRYGLSVFDAMIAASALEAGCDTLWSEDMQDGLLIDGQLRLANPFRSAV